MYSHVMALVWKAVDKLWELVLSFNHMDHGGQTLIIRFGGKLHYLLSHVGSLTYSFKLTSYNLPS